LGRHILTSTFATTPKKIVHDWHRKKFEDLKYAVVHELFQVFTDPFYGQACERYINKEELNPSPRDIGRSPRQRAAAGSPRRPMQRTVL
jgi:hypothetical protein